MLPLAACASESGAAAEAAVQVPSFNLLLAPKSKIACPADTLLVATNVTGAEVFPLKLNLYRGGSGGIANEASSWSGDSCSSRNILSN